MKRTLLVCALGAMLAGVVRADAATRRFAVVVGANRGAAGRVPLRYAVADAERFAAVVTEMGGVRPADCILLRDPDRRAFLDALQAARASAGGARPAADRVEVLVYFSGHADEQGLMLGRELVPYRELRTALADVAADVGITVLDACASGAITRLKGGRVQPPFLTDASTQVQGYAFLTSSSETEAAQESDKLQGSFFTHALLTGLRGAADASGDGKVTLGEAYQFAFAETLSQTTTSQAGAQHPAYDIKMAGTGDVVMTDLRQTSASLILGPEYEGRFFVMDAHRRLSAELFKPLGRIVELGLEPGEYEVYFQQEKALLSSTLKLQDGQHLELARAELREAKRMPAQSRGEEPEPVVETHLNGRWHVLANGAVTNVGVEVLGDNVTAEGGSGAFRVSRWATERIAVDFWIHAIDAGAITIGGTTRAGTDVGFLFGARYYPLPAARLLPYAGGALGPFVHTGTITGPIGTTAGTSDARFGSMLSAGLDLRLGGHFTFNVDNRITFRTDRDEQYDLSLGLGWIFGHGR